MLSLRSVLLVIGASMVAGCGGGHGGAGGANGASVPPNPLRFTGGKVTISAEVAVPPDGAVLGVWAVITKQPDDSEYPKKLEFAMGSGQTYEVEWTIPANTSVDGKEVKYSVAVSAKDQESHDLQPSKPHFSSVKDPTDKDVTGVTWPTITVPAAFTDDIPSAPAFP